MNVGQSEIAALEFVGQLRVVQAHQVKDGRVQIVDLNRIFDDVVAEIVSLADRDPGESRIGR